MRGGGRREAGGRGLRFPVCARESGGKSAARVAAGGNAAAAGRFVQGVRRRDARAHPVCAADGGGVRMRPREVAGHDTIRRIAPIARAETGTAD